MQAFSLESLPFRIYGMCLAVGTLARFVPAGIPLPRYRKTIPCFYLVAACRFRFLF